MNLLHPRGFPIHAERMGRGPRRALALHCSLAHGGAWRGVAAHLGDLLTLHAIDLPGHGRSGDWGGRQGYHDLTTDLVSELVDDLAGEEGIDLIGHSLGATIALRLALRAPERLRSLTLIEPVVFAAARVSAPDVFADHRRRSADFSTAWERGDIETAARAFLGHWGAGQSWADMPQPQRDYMMARLCIVAETDPDLSADRAGLLRRGGLEALHLPVLLLEGALSPPVIGAIIAELARRLPDARRQSVAGAAHMLPITHPLDTGAAIREFLIANG